MKPDIHQRWEAADPLDFAWRLVPDQTLQIQYENSDDDKREVVIWDMKRELLHRLAGGTLHGIGFPVRPRATGEPKSIASHFFTDPTAVDWSRSRIAYLGWVFEQVRIDGLPVRFLRGQPEAAKQQDALPTADAETLPPRMGRPSAMEHLVPLIAELEREGRLNVPSKQREMVMREMARMKHPQLFRTSGQPGRSTIMKAFALYRKRRWSEKSEKSE